MSASAVIRKFGEKVLIDGERTRAFVLPMHHKNGEIHTKPLPMGVKNGESYLLICGSAVNEGSLVILADESFEVKRSTPVRFMGEISHYEAVLRSLGRNDDV